MNFLRTGTWLYASLLSILASLASADSHAQTLEPLSDDRSEEAEITATMDICWNQAIPSGYVVVAEKSTTACQNTNYPGQPNTRTVKEPNPAGEIVCGFPLPTGYVITTDEIKTTACRPSSSTSGWNALSVKLAGHQETVCSNSPIPPGYSYSPTSSSSVCRSGFSRVITRQ